MATDVEDRTNGRSIYVVCVDVRSLANVGQIFRVCDAIRVERLYLCGITGYPPVVNDRRPPWVADRAGRAIAKTAIQTVESVTWDYRPSAVDVIRELKDRGAWIAALEPTTESVDYTRVGYRFPVCLVVGHERSGIPDPVLALADVTLGIPMYGHGTSLNVALALGICGYEIVRQRSQQSPGSTNRSMAGPTSGFGMT